MELPQGIKVDALFAHQAHGDRVADQQQRLLEQAGHRLLARLGARTRFPGGWHMYEQVGVLLHRAILDDADTGHFRTERLGFACDEQGESGLAGTGADDEQVLVADGRLGNLADHHGVDAEVCESLGDGLEGELDTADAHEEHFACAGDQIG